MNRKESQQKAHYWEGEVYNALDKKIPDIKWCWVNQEKEQMGSYDIVGFLPDSKNSVITIDVKWKNNDYIEGVTNFIVDLDTLHEKQNHFYIFVYNNRRALVFRASQLYKFVKNTVADQTINSHYSGKSAYIYNSENFEVMSYDFSVFQKLCDALKDK
ncbi:MAG: hypothetical protein J6Y29_03760 [Clostridiales bacterium]|nr:hypothetical protein [Clostridiales bacterium]